MLVQLAYGEGTLDVELPDAGVTVVEPEFVRGLPDERSGLVEALRRPLAGLPLADLAKPGRRVVVVFSDLTRPVPNRRILPPILSELLAAGIDREDITLLNATGLHRPNTPAELATMLGDDVARQYRVVNHDAHDRDRLVHVGRTARGNDVWLNREYVEADVRILTGFVEPHFFAGFSGGAKSVLPGVAGEETILRNHGAPMLADSRATWGVTRGNPVFEEAREAARLAPPQFVLNVTTNKHKEITGVFAGEMAPAHDAGCAFARRTAMRPVPEPFDVVVTTNSGYPLDLNLYQAVKGMSAAAQVVRRGGAIVMAAECREGIGHGHFAEILQMGRNPAELLEVITRPGFLMVDQWEAQMLANILLHCRVYLYSDRLSPEDTRLAHLQPSPGVAATLADLAGQVGPELRIGVLPQGPLTIPYVAGRSG